MLRSEEEEFVVLTTQKQMPRWLRIVLKSLAALLTLAIIIAAIIGWRYYVTHRRLQRALSTVINHEEYVRSLGGINAVSDLIIPDAPENWRFRYLSSVRARKSLVPPTIRVKTVAYDNFEARVRLSVNGTLQFRQYQLQQDQSWKRAPFTATEWGKERSIKASDDVEIVYHNRDKDFAKALAREYPDLIKMMPEMGLSPGVKRVEIVPGEFGDLIQLSADGKTLLLNSPHVDLIYTVPQDISPQHMLKLALAHKVIGDARKQNAVVSALPGAARVQNAIDDVLAWRWATGEISDDTLSVWARTLKGRWVSPVTGLPPNLITQLPTEAPDAAARLMMAWLLRKEGPGALYDLTKQLPDAHSWDEAYEGAVGRPAFLVERAAALVMRNPDAPWPDWPTLPPAAPPQTLTLLSTAPDANGRLLGQLATGEVILLQPGPDVAFTMQDGSTLAYECVAPGTQVKVKGAWLDSDLWLQVNAIELDQAILPLALQTPAQDPQTFAEAWRYQEENRTGYTFQLALVQLFPGAVVNAIAHPSTIPYPYPPTLSRIPPLLVWQQKTAHCDRNWMVAYDPGQGVVGAWLAPKKTPFLTTAIRSTAEDADILLMTLTGADDTRLYRSGDHHTLLPVSPQSYPEMLARSPARWTPYIDNADKTLQVIDAISGKLITLYRPAADEEIVAIIPVWGETEGIYYFTVRHRNDAVGPVQVKRVSRLKPGQATLAFDVSPRGAITSMAICPDQSILYGYRIPASPRDKSILRRHTSTGEDTAVSVIFDELFAPIHCTRPPASLLPKSGEQ
ncbi:MAG: hypothetical protein DSY55_04595 [Clostridia bacterium]|nr:MAG: hypothetical protein DSY55_04595 [Clostridia bacterium]